MDRQRVTDIVRAIREFGSPLGNFGDVWEAPTIEDLEVALDLTKREASDVNAILSGSPMSRLQELTDQQCVTMRNWMVEGFHGSFDGWEETDKIVIELFVNDLLLGMEEWT